VGASPISGFDSHFSHFAQGFVALGFRLSYITFYALIAVFFVWILWNKTRFGKNIFAIGGNPEAAKVSGVNVALNLLMIYALSGVFYAFGACWKPVVSVRRPITSALCMNWTPSPPAWWAAYRSAAG
jgi:methyl-galactoside transport system permease protein